MRPAVAGHFTGADIDQDKVKDFMNAVRVIERYLADGDKSFMVGNTLTIADVVLAGLLSLPYQLSFGSEFFEKMPNAAAWLARIVGLPSFVRRFGYIKANGHIGAPAVVAKKAGADDDLDDLFGDDDEDDKPKVVVVAKKKKKEVIAMSLVMLEVKPLDSETNLDDLAKKLFAEVKNDEGGLYWKTEYKKEPVAFGIFKLIVGFSCEDEKVSVDGIVEKIEAYEDLVQSVEIAAFNKI